MNRNRTLGLFMAAYAAIILMAGCGSGTGAGDLVERAVGTWDCTVRFSEDSIEVTADIDADGSYTLTGQTGDEITGTWERDGDEVSITADAPFIEDLTYQGATDDPEELTVVEADGVSGVFDVEIDGDRVTFTQVEYGDGEPANPEFPVVYDCTKQG